MYEMVIDGFGAGSLGGVSIFVNTWQPDNVYLEGSDAAAYCSRSDRTIYINPRYLIRHPDEVVARTQELLNEFGQRGDDAAVKNLVLEARKKIRSKFEKRFHATLEGNYIVVSLRPKDVPAQIRQRLGGRVPAYYVATQAASLKDVADEWVAFAEDALATGLCGMAFEE